MGSQQTRLGGSSYRRITTATTTNVSTKSAILRRIVIGTTAAGTITVNDGLGTVLVLKASMPEGSYQVDALCVSKLDVITGAASDITIVYDPVA
jgi:hypothetical protein